VEKWREMESGKLRGAGRKRGAPTMDAKNKYKERHELAI